MAEKKKGVKKKATKKTASKKSAKKSTPKKKSQSSKKTIKSLPQKTSKIAQKTEQKINPTKRRIHLVIKNLLLFSVLTIISYVLFTVSTNPIYDSFFYLLSIILGFVSLAFLISLLVLLVLRAMKK
jgi:membrane glycosyltransferase